MARVAPVVPELNDVLCEACGYVLNGLPADSRCPECGTPIADSSGTKRFPPLWESEINARGFLHTSLEIIFHPRRFYRTITVRGDRKPARLFATRHWEIAGLLFGLAAATHFDWYEFVMRSFAHAGSFWGLRSPIFVVVWLIATAAAYFALDVTTRIAAKLTSWEAAYRGIRLPYDIVLRGMHYHAAHYFPVALLAAVTVVGYGILYSWNILDAFSATTYLYILSAEVVLGAIYLFNTYWIAMRNMMYANR